MAHNVITSSDVFYGSKVGIDHNREMLADGKILSNVLFLAPSWPYAKTVITRLGKKLDKEKIPYNSVVTGAELSLSTSTVHVSFICSDPQKWTFDIFTNMSSVFGKKELIETARKKWPRMHIPATRMSLDKYVIDNSIEDEPIVTSTATYIPAIKTVHFNYPATVVLWEDGTKTVVMCQEGDFYSYETGLALCIAKKSLGNMSNFNNVFRKWIPEEDVEENNTQE